MWGLPDLNPQKAEVAHEVEVATQLILAVGAIHIAQLAVDLGEGRVRGRLWPNSEHAFVPPNMDALEVQVPLRSDEEGVTIRKESILDAFEAVANEEDILG